MQLADLNHTSTQTHREHSKHGLSNVEGMSPIMIGDRSVVLPHSQNPPVQHLGEIHDCGFG